MNTKLLHPEVQQYIDEHLHTDLSKLIFKGSPFKEVSIQEIATQIAAKKKAKSKLPSWFATQDIYYPPKLNLEQTSSEITANYKAKLVSGKSLIDLTGGFGVDSWAFSKNTTQVTHCEINEGLSKIASHNFNQLACDNCNFVLGDGLEYLKNTTTTFDWIYIDPSRRVAHKGKVFLMADCLPNVPDHLDFLFTKAKNILIKSSPILDLTSSINELKFVKEIHIIAVENEVKELLFLLAKDHTGSIQIKTVNHSKEQLDLFEFSLDETADSQYALPKAYLYEPNAAILKSGGFHQISQQLKLEKLQQHSHLYTADQLIAFPGRTFVVEEVLPYDKKALKKAIPNSKANITTRNFPETVAQIRKKTKLKDGGDHYLFFTTNLNKQLQVIICKKL